MGRGKKKQESKPKPADAAYRAVLSILKSKELRIGQYHEVVKIRVPELRRYNEKRKTLETQKNAFVELVSRPVCCLSDIPIAHLS